MPANGFDVEWVMSQVGHADSKMTMDVYAQLEQRVDHSHGLNFDRLIREAREASNGQRLGQEVDLERFGATGGPAANPQEPADLQGTSEMASPGLEPGTPRFSVVCSTN